MSDTRWREGWGKPPGSRKWHYFRNATALCGRYGFRLTDDNEPDTGKPSPDDCTACRKKLEASRDP